MCGGRNAAGVELDKHLEQEVVYCINDETHTFFRSHCQSSLLDLCLVTEPLLGKLESFSVQNWFDSDHRPIVCTFGNEQPCTEQSQYEREFETRSLNLMNKDISGFADAVRKVMTEVELWPEMSLEDMYNKLQHIIIRTLKKCGALSKKKSHKNHQPWFTKKSRI